MSSSVCKLQWEFQFQLDIRGGGGVGKLTPSTSGRGKYQEPTEILKNEDQREETRPTRLQKKLPDYSRESRGIAMRAEISRKAPFYTGGFITSPKWCFKLMWEVVGHLLSTGKTQITALHHMHQLIPVLIRESSK